MTLSDRERFLSLLFTAPLLRADAIVLLAGEDADARAAFAAGLYHQAKGSMPIYVTGGRDEPPRHIGADAVAGKLMGHGVPPNQITTETRSKHTWDQALLLASEVSIREWKRILLVASSYHLPRAYLSVLAALDEFGIHTTHVVPVAASAPWSESPPGVTETRDRLLSCEAAKIDEYGGRGHVASYAEGIASLLRWERS